MKTNEIRTLYLDFFKEREHLVERSASLIPSNDPTLLFTTAGMVQFKPFFAGIETPTAPRITTVQKSLRAGGKDSDLENVGRTSRHHTFFEMLGNFSFGDYFKKESIAWAWEFVTKVVKLPVDKLWVSIYVDDDEAFEIWNKEVGVPAERIVRLGKKDNFWGPAGDSGACGPCTEIHFDRGVEWAVRGPRLERCENPTCAPGCDCERYLEFWNVVFNQFYQDSDGTQKPLPSVGVDTGMGLERLTMIIQGARSPFETDILAALGEVILQLVPGPIKRPLSPKRQFPLNVMIDHTRALTFAIADGVIPSNEGRGYVLRKILRRAVRFAKQLGVEEPFMYKAVHKVVEFYRDVYPELEAQRSHVEATIKSEEESFHMTLREGTDRLLDLIEDLKIAGSKCLAGDKAFDLYATNGFPLELTIEILEDHHMEVERDRFDELMAEHRKRSKTDKFGGPGVDQGVDAVSIRAHGGAFLGASRAPGDHQLESDSKLTILTPVDEGGLIRFFLNPSPFYPEGGGQVSDQGLVVHDDFEIRVQDAQKLADVVIHVGSFLKGRSPAGDVVQIKDLPVTARVDRGHRLATARHHTATHVLNAALRKHLGSHVRQAGSLVTPDRLRFDFTHNSSLGHDVVTSIETEVNEVVLENLAVKGEEMDYKDATRAGALAFFGDKYGDRVRTVKIEDYSFELCGGTHVGATGEIGLITIVSEGSVAAGTRRLEALTGDRARSHVLSRLARFDGVVQTLKISEDQVLKRVEGLVAREKELNRKVQDLQMKLATGGGDDAGDAVEEIGGLKVAVKNLGEMDMGGLRSAADTLMNKLGAQVLVLGSHVGDKVFLVAKVDKSVAGKTIKAGDIIKPVAEHVGGAGGGRPDMAQAGGTEPAKLDEALGLVKDVVRSFVGA